MLFTFLAMQLQYFQETSKFVYVASKYIYMGRVFHDYVLLDLHEK